MARPPKHMLNPFKCQVLLLLLSAHPALLWWAERVGEQEAAGPEAWGEVYDDLERPLLLDIGCGQRLLCLRPLCEERC
eukprot:2553089-Rhodomonas_salina.2